MRGVRHERILVMSGDRVQEVRIFAVAVTVALNLIEGFALAFELRLPLFVAVVRFRPLQATQNAFVLVGHSGNLLYSDCTIQ